MVTFNFFSAADNCALDCHTIALIPFLTDGNVTSSFKETTKYCVPFESSVGNTANVAMFSFLSNKLSFFFGLQEYNKIEDEFLILYTSNFPLGVLNDTSLVTKSYSFAFGGSSNVVVAVVVVTVVFAFSFASPEKKNFAKGTKLDAKASLFS